MKTESIFKWLKGIDMSTSKLQHALAAAVIGVAGVAGSAHAATVDTVLSLVIDVSGSIDGTEYTTQMKGYAEAFRDTSIQNGILDMGGGDVGKIAVNVVQFGTSASEVIGFTILDSIMKINDFATALEGQSRVEGGSTDIAEGIDVAAQTIASWLNTAGNAATRRVIDVSGDGTDNTGGSVTVARNAACPPNVINGITVGGGASLLNYYQNSVQCGTGSFSLAAADFDDFGNVVKTKLRAEITGEPPTVPLPASAVLLLAGLGGFAAFKRKPSKKS
ncbi:DUF1194 domain-containing protein [Sedimentitalea arenosa]|nr:DUF1194 domain-containing protein [Arenibacterium arenosum]